MRGTSLLQKPGSEFGEKHLGPAENYFGSLITDTKVSRVVLPVFFGQADACLVSRRGFEAMCELNPQLATDLTAIATSPLMVLCFYAFRKNYNNSNRHVLANVHTRLLTSPAGRQLATLFQFEGLTIRDGTCLASALSVLDTAERVRSPRDAGRER